MLEKIRHIGLLSISMLKMSHLVAIKIPQPLGLGGITTDIDRREREHQQRWQGGRIVQVGGMKTEAEARAWEANQDKTITPPRK